MSHATAVKQYSRDTLESILAAYKGRIAATLTRWELERIEAIAQEIKRRKELKR